MSERLNSKFMLSGSSLFYALVISLLIAIVSVAFITIAYYQRLLLEHDFIQEKLLRNASSGLNILLSEEQSSISPYTLDLYGGGNDSIRLSKQKWGLFEVAIAESFQETIKGKQDKHKIALIGCQPDSVSQSALYITNNKQPLSIAGSTKIIGTTYLSRKGIESTIIDKDTYKGDKLVYGDAKKSIPSFPKIDFQLLKDIEEKQQKVATVDIYSLGDSLEHSFLSPTLYIRANYLHIDHQLLKGNICLIADSMIYIGRNTVVEDVLIYAPSIKIESGFVGSVQAFSSKKLEIGEHTNFTYPSVLSLFKNPRSLTAPTCTIGANTTINGTVLIWADDVDNQAPSLTIQEKSTIKGRVFANAITNLYGSIYGNITLYKFNLNIAGATYDNHIYDVTIDATKRSKYYLEPFMQKNKRKTAIAKWLN